MRPRLLLSAGSVALAALRAGAQPADEPPAVFASAAIGLGAAYDFAGASVEIGYRHASVFAAAGLPDASNGLANFVVRLPAATAASVDFDGYRSFAVRYSLAIGARVYSHHAGGAFLSTQFATLAYRYNYDEGPLPTRGYAQFLTAVAGYRYRFGRRFFAELGGGLGLSIVGNHSQPHDGGPHPFRSGLQLWGPDVAAGIGVLIW